MASREKNFTDVKVRRAMAHLVPVDEIVEVLLPVRVLMSLNCQS